MHCSSATPNTWVCQRFNFQSRLTWLTPSGGHACRASPWELLPRHLLTAPAPSAAVDPADVHRNFTFGAREVIAWILVILVGGLGAAVGMGGALPCLRYPAACLAVLSCTFPRTSSRTVIHILP